ncbi:hypothetical protein GGF46_004027 [Coemansia sp. RSA 552]|nr:hypothetical protein GGF46_004027 [Coemansia sp. RSA 552]
MSSHIPLPKERHNKSKLYVTVSGLGSKKQEHISCIESHPFNYRLSIVAPQGSNKVGQTLARHVGSYFKISLRLADLIDPAFIANYVKRNTVVALSTTRYIDADDVFAIDGRGYLVLNVCKDTYETLGLVGRQAQFPLERGARFIIEIDLKSDLMDPAKKYFQRIHSRFRAVLDELVEFTIGYYDKDGRPLNLDLPGASIHEPRFEEHRLVGALVPEISEQFIGAKKQSEEWADEAQGIFEWIGLAASGSRAVIGSERPDAHTCLYDVPEPNTPADLCVTTATGLLSAKAISTVVQELLGDPQTPEFYICVWGHEDAPVSWNRSEHGYLVSGENMYAQMYRPSQRSCVVGFQACGPWDTFS